MIKQGLMNAKKR